VETVIFFRELCQVHGDSRNCYVLPRPLMWLELFMLVLIAEEILKSLRGWWLRRVFYDRLP
jgi:hypothetical protein